MSKKPLLLLGVVILAVAAIGLIISKRGTVAHGPLERTSLRLAWLPGATFAGDYVALNKGFWTQEGLNVTINPGGFENDAIKLVAAGADTFGITSGPQLLQARASGVPIVAIGATMPRSPIGWIAKKTSGIKAPRDFIGKRVGAQFGTHTEITLEALCGKLNIPLTSFQRIPVKFDPRPFVVGDVDVLPVYIIDQPIDLRRAGLSLNIIDPNDYGVAFAYGNLYFATEETIRTKPQLVSRFLRGAQRGWMSAKEAPSSASEILAGYATGAKRDLLEEKLAAMFAFISKSAPQYIGIFPMKAQAWEDSRDILTKYGHLKTVSVDELFTNKFLNIEKRE
jgi:NitT/TauT family transport system substrate-binding protein